MSVISAQHSPAYLLYKQQHYIRTDIPCGVAGCTQCTSPPPKTLPSSIPHVILPDASTLEKYLDIFSAPELEGVILLSSTLTKLSQSSNLRRSARIRRLYTDPLKKIILFDNLHCQGTAPLTEANIRTGNDLIAAADWYYHHLQTALQKPVYILSDTLANVVASSPHEVIRQPQADDTLDDDLEELFEKLGVQEPDYIASSTIAAGGDTINTSPITLSAGVHILRPSTYFKTFWSHVPGITDICDSLDVDQEEEEATHQLDTSISTTTVAKKKHLSPVVVAAGLSKGELLKGVFNVDARNRQQAVVNIGGGVKGAERAVVIAGKGAMNRALHGDIVAVRLLPVEQWQRVVTDDDEEGDGIAGAGTTDLDSGLMEGPADEMGEGAVTGGVESTWDEENTWWQRLQDDSPGLQPCGEVVAIIHRNTEDIVACIAEEDEKALLAKSQHTHRQEAVLCVPFDRRYPLLRLRSRHLPSLLNQRIVLRFDTWELGSNYPQAHLVKVLGSIGDLKAETDAVLVKSGIRWQPFSESALSELPQNDNDAQWKIPEEEISCRKDLRGPEYFICSIDPPGCTDVDDALHTRDLGNGRVELGVHIADVSYFVRQNSALDAEAAARCTTVYLVDRRLDMLPNLLSEDVASLRSGKDRLALSMICTLSSVGDKDNNESSGSEIESVWFGRTIIRSRYQLEYQQAQDIVDGKPPSCPGHKLSSQEDYDVLVQSLKRLFQIAKDRRKRRLENGAIELESAELRFEVGAGGMPKEVKVKKEVPMMAVVAEMMILANSLVAQRIYDATPRSALLRRHPPPRPSEGVLDVLKLCQAALGAPLPISLYKHPTNNNINANMEELGAVLREACAKAPPAMASLIKSAASRAMSEATYFCAGSVDSNSNGTTDTTLGHFGLGLQYYTHFTSPIRRYADVVVHRQLLAAVAAENEQNASLLLNRDGVERSLPLSVLTERVSEMNSRHRAAKRAQMDCAELYLLLLLQQQPCVVPAVVCGILGQGKILRIFVPKYHIKGIVHLIDRQGNVIPPSSKPEEDAYDELPKTPSQLVIRSTGDNSNENDSRKSSTSTSVSIVRNDTGDVVSEYTMLTKVWVLLKGDGTRAHGPALRVRLLCEDHHAVVQAVKDQNNQKQSTGATLLAPPPGFEDVVLMKQQQKAAVPPLEVQQQQSSFVSSKVNVKDTGYDEGSRNTNAAKSSLATALKQALSLKDDGRHREQYIVDSNQRILTEDVVLLKPSKWEFMVDKLLKKACRHALRALKAPPNSDSAVKHWRRVDDMLKAVELIDGYCSV